MNSPVRIFLTSLASSSCTESIAASVAGLEQFPGLGLDMCNSGRLLLVDAAEEGGVTSTEDSPVGGRGGGCIGS